MEHNQYAQPLLCVILNCSRFRACTATDAALAGLLKVSKATVSRALRDLETKGRVKCVTTPYSPTLNARRRTIYVVSPVTDDEGALKLTRLARRNGKVTTRSVDVLCGWLACTPEQLGTWVAKVGANGWFEVKKVWSSYKLTRTATCPFFEDHHRVKAEPRPLVMVGPPARARLGLNVLHYFNDGLHAEDSDEAVAEAIHSTPDAVRVTIGKLVKASKLHRRWDGDRRVVSPYLVFVQAACEDLASRLSKVLREVGLMEASTLKARLGNPSPDRFKKAIGRARKGGVLRAERIGGVTYYVAEPVSERAARQVRYLREEAEFKTPDQDQVQRVVNRLVSKEGLDRLRLVASSPFLKRMNFLMPEGFEREHLRAVARAAPPGADLAQYCAQRLFDDWKITHRDSIEWYRSIEHRVPPQSVGIPCREPTAPSTQTAGA